MLVKEIISRRLEIQNLLLTILRRGKIARFRNVSERITISINFFCKNFKLIQYGLNKR